MEYLTKFKQYSYYKWVYIVGTVIVLLNSILVQSKVLSGICLIVLYCILFFKGFMVLINYKKVEKKQYPAIEKKDFIKTYRLFRIKVLLFWIAFIILCVIARFVIKLDHSYFYACTFFFLLLDRMFINSNCLLRKFSNSKKEEVVCCCGCPCRGWDLLMINTPLLFALNNQSEIENVLICISTVISIFSFIYWEKEKYNLVEIRKKCTKHCNLSLCRENLK